MDNQILKSDNNKNKIIDSSPFPDKFQNEIDAIESFYKCFDKRYDACPAFFMGTLRDACHEAFSSTQIEERRPVLIYIHNDNNLFNNIFCMNIFCSTKMIDYLIDNYIVWPWDITLESNRDILTKIWEEIFSTKFFDDFSIEQCPLLIGIMRLFEDKTNELIKSEYQFKSLLKCDILTRTHKLVNCKILLNELYFFKKECDENEEVLSFGFVRSIGLCWEIILEIVQYLSLNDAVSAFSTAIIPLLNNPQSKFQLSNPSIPFIKMIRQKFKSEQIVSLKLNSFRLESKTELEFLSFFKKIISITLLNLPYENEISHYEIYFPNLTCLSLCYNDEVNFNMFHTMFNQLWKGIKRLEIHSAGTVCTHFGTSQFHKWYRVNTTVEYFVLDVGHFSMISMNKCFGHNNFCFLTTIIDFIRKMESIRHLYLIINKYNVEQLLVIEQWEFLVMKCFKLKKIIIQVLGNSFQNEQLIQKTLNIQKKLCNIRKTIKFQISFL